MREIKFRAKVETGDWAYGSLVIKKGKDLDEVYIVENGISLAVTDENTICQYTGLKDKNGNEIYDSDVVKSRHNRNPYLVEFKDCRFVIEDKWGTAIKTTQEAIDHFECEVIGNVFDSPELVGGEK